MVSLEFFMLQGTFHSIEFMTQEIDLVEIKRSDLVIGFQQVGLCVFSIISNIFH